MPDTFDGDTGNELPNHKQPFQTTLEDVDRALAHELEGLCRKDRIDKLLELRAEMAPKNQDKPRD